MKISKITILATLFIAVCCFNGFSKPEKNTVIINNEAKSSSSAGQQVISAPALVPSDAVKLRGFREKQEIKTEDFILKELEKQRLLDEQKRVDKMLGHSQPAQSPVHPATSHSLKPAWDEWFFGKKSFVSFGAGFVTYYEVDNVNSNDQPAFFASFGGYGYEGYLIFELSAYYSKHYLIPISNYNNFYFREAVEQPALSMAVKLTPFKGRVKPYIGVSGALVARKWDYVSRDGTDLDETNLYYKAVRTDVGRKRWYFSFDAGAAIGADVALGEYLGLNVDLRYHLNLHTENRRSVHYQYQYFRHTEILDERDSLIGSVNLRYYFR
ncbi:MAG: hypothetical protein OXJ52_08955 [Oligoflexia bacterium]|nr:hypothetical protein [Oligoflexia bacterium]